LGAKGLSGDRAALHYAAIVEHSDDAILSKDLNGVITSWNNGAQRLFGYTAEEAVGRPVTILIPADRINEEPMILDRIRRGERIEHYETIRQRKDGSLIYISLTVSPIKNQRGEIVGASKIARDVTELRRARERQELLLREMSHRVKNLFAMAISVLSLSGRFANSVPELVALTRDRLGALARAHDLILPHGAPAGAAKPTTLHSLIEAITSPHDIRLEPHPSKFSITGCNVQISEPVISTLALLIHEFVTNSAKYGALSAEAGRIEIHCEDDGESVVVLWTERGGPEVASPRSDNGFGELLTRSAVATLGGEISRDWRRKGLVIRLSIPRERLTG
jgi:PAS domain S-box-containing protein